MRIALDVNGGDFGLKPNIEGALQAIKKLPHEIILVGREAEIKEELLLAHGIKTLPERLSIVHAQQIIDMGGEAVAECKAKPDSSMMVAADLVKQGKADAFVSAGNSGATMVAALLKMKRIRGVVRPAIAALLPTYSTPSLLLDAGANMDCKPLHLLQFAVMGSIYMENLLKIEKPTVGIFSIGEEESKGNLLVQQTMPVLKKMGLNFIGPIEGRDLPSGQTNVILADGFVGNIALKLYEGTAGIVFTMLKDQIKCKFTYKIGALLMRNIFKELKIKMNADIYGGAPLLGIDGIALVCHGKSNSNAIYNALRVSAELAASGMIEQVRKRMEELKPTFDAIQAQGISIKKVQE